MPNNAISEEEWKAARQYPIVNAALLCGSHVELIGGRYMTRCFNPRAHSHGDYNPSVHLIDKTNAFVCRLCGGGKSKLAGDEYEISTSGDVITFVANSMKSSMGTAAKLILEWSKEPCKVGLDVDRQCRVQLDSPNGSFSNIYHYLRGQCENAWDNAGIRALLEDGLGIRAAVLRSKDIGYLADAPKGLDVRQRLLEKYKLNQCLIDAGVINKEYEMAIKAPAIVVPFIEGGRITYLAGGEFERTEGKMLIRWNGLHVDASPIYNISALKLSAPHREIYLCINIMMALKFLSADVPAVSVLSHRCLGEETIKTLKTYDMVYNLIVREDEAQNSEVREFVKRAKAEMLTVRLFTLPAKLSQQQLSNILELRLSRTAGWTPPVQNEEDRREGVTLQK